MVQSPARGARHVEGRDLQLSVHRHSRFRSHRHYGMKDSSMKITQGTFSFLPDLTDTEIRAQVDYALAQGWAIGVEYTDDPHPRNFLWEMWGNPMFDLRDAAGVMMEVKACRKAFPDHYIRINAFDSTRGFE